MSTQSYPFNAWALTKEFAPYKVELVGAGSFGRHKTAGGKSYSSAELHGCKKRAVIWARACLARQELELKDRVTLLERRKQELAIHADL